jgi:hypothetical protein
MTAVTALYSKNAKPQVSMMGHGVDIRGRSGVEGEIRRYV